MRRLSITFILATAALSLAAPVVASAVPLSKVAHPGERVVLWSDPSAVGQAAVAQVILEARSSSPALADAQVAITRQATAGCQMRGVNALGWTLWEYTVYQTFNYDGTSITYLPAPTRTANAYWGWYDAGSGNPSSYWISQPTSAYALGTYYFRHDLQDYHESRSGWVRDDVRGSGSWWCSGA